MGIADFLDAEQDRIISEWSARARELPHARAMPGLVLLDHLPQLLAELARWLRTEDVPAAVSFDRCAKLHAVQRLHHRFDLRHVVAEYQALRGVILGAYGASGACDPREIARLDHAIDHAIAEAVERYAEERERALSDHASRTQLALDAAHLGTWDYLPTTGELAWDARTRAIFGVDADEPMTYERFLAAVHPDDRARVDAAVQRSMRSGEPYAIEMRVRGSGGERWVESRGEVSQRDDAGRAVRFAGVVLDVTERHALEVERGEAIRYLRAFERVATAAWEADGLDALLRSLLEVFVDTAASVDTATILMREGAHLRVRATTGLEDELRERYAVPIGVGFAGTIARTRRPLHLEDAASSPVVVSPWIRERGVRGLYGVPLIVDDDLVGVAHIGSRTVRDFPSADKRLFAAVAQRATSALVKERLRDAAVRRTAELEAVLEAVPDAFLLGTRDEVRLANAAALRLLGARAASELGGGPPLARLDPREMTTSAPVPPDGLALVRALRGERIAQDLTVRDAATANDVHVKCSAAPVVVDGAIVAAVAILTDVSHLVRLERERDLFMNAVVHDLRSPLSTIRTSAELVARKVEAAGDAKSAVTLRRIDGSVKRIDRLLSDLLDLALADSGRLTVDRLEADVGAIVEEQAASWAASARPHRIVAAAERIVARVDEGRVRQVIDNLVGNAIKYSPPGGDVRITCARDGAFARVAVSDRGAGIAPEHQRAIFEPYVRLSGDVRGHGLGLFIASQLVAAHGGEIGVTSAPGEGTTVWFTLPAE